MEEKTASGLREQQARRKRVNRMKMSMVAGGAIWILVLTVLIVVLLIKVVNLEERMDKELVSKEEVLQEHNEKSAESPKENASDTVLQDGAQTEDISDNDTAGSGDLTEDTGLADDTDLAAESAALSDGTDSADEGAALSDNSDSAAGGTDSAKEGQAVGEATEEDSNLLEEGEHPKVYLTFDDGPSENTAKILDILKEKNVKATFFVIGQEDEESKALYQRIVAEGHTLGMHSYSHKYDVIYKSLDAFKEDMNQLQTYLEEVTGVTPTIMRFPGGSSNQVSNVDIKELIRYVKGQGITYYDWNVVSGDATSQVYTPDELVANVMDDVVKYHTSIVLMHDSSAKASTVEALRSMIDQLQELGAELLPIDETTKPIQHIKAEDVD